MASCLSDGAGLRVWLVHARSWSLNRKAVCPFISCSRVPSSVQTQTFQRCLINNPKHEYA